MPTMTPREAPAQSRRYVKFPNVRGDSPIAAEIGDDDARRANERTVPVHGLVVHMTGGSIVSKAVERGADPVEFCHAYYTKKDYSVHYLIGYGGELYQYTDDRLRTPHVGVSADERRAYLSGAWARGGTATGQGSEGKVGPINPKTVERWRAAWPGYASPQHLFPTKFVNDSYCGVEMPPCGFHVGGVWKALPKHNPMRPGLRHTLGQHVAIAILAWDLAERWGWPGDWYDDPRGGSRSPRLPGHEDVDLFGRSNRSGGWDPGSLRENVWFDWPFVYDVIRKRPAAGSFEAFVSKVTRELLGK